jgi:hypothetical protein
MDIHARIGYELSSGEVRSIYNNRSGELSFLGQSLRQKYSTEQEVLSLLDGGDLDVIESPVDWNDSPASPSIPLRYKDRGDPNVDAKTYSDIDAFLNATLTAQGSYSYLYTKRYSSDELFRWVYFSVPESIPEGYQITDCVQWTFLN